MNSFMYFTVIVLASLNAILSIPLFIRLRWPSPVLWFLKLYVSALSPLLAFFGLVFMIAGLATGSIFISLPGFFGFSVYFIHYLRVTRPPDAISGFEQAFGLNWEKRIDPKLKARFLPKRTILRLPEVPKARMEQNIEFTTIPGTDRKIFCDLWQPPEHVRPTGLAIIYLHGSAFYLLDKDLGTRPLFGHLAAQGHVIMDLAYRLAPETDIMGMVHDVKRAIVWMKEMAGNFGIDPGQIVLAGGSAGGHLALLAAYTANDPAFIPKDLKGKDVSVCSVASLYGTPDLEAIYYHTNQHLTTRSIPGRPKKSVPTKMPGWMVKTMGENFHRLGFDKGFVNAGALAPLLGGHPDECPERYAFLSPVTHVHPQCPPTLLIHGEDDIMAPVKSTLFLYARLQENKVPVVMHILPQTDHAFDLILPKISPAAHNELFDLERFLALQVKSTEKLVIVKKEKEEYQLDTSS
jgi:acetyl esterase/lipase